jgi:hypothetical protein
MTMEHLTFTMDSAKVIEEIYPYELDADYGFSGKST